MRQSSGPWIALTPDAPADASVKTYSYDVEDDTVSYLAGVSGTIVAACDEATGRLPVRRSDADRGLGRRRGQDHRIRWRVRAVAGARHRVGLDVLF